MFRKRAKMVPVLWTASLFLSIFLLRLHRALDQPWMLGLAALRRCIQQRHIPFASLSVVLEEIVSR